MTNISEIIEEILVEWAYRVHDGMPNPKNAQHIHELRESMEELNLPNNVIYQVIQNLINEEDKEHRLDDKEKEKAKSMKLVHLGRGSYGKKGKEATHQAVDGKLVKKGDEEKPEQETKPPMTIDPNPMGKKDSEDKKKSKVEQNADNARNTLDLKVSKNVTDSEKGADINRLLQQVGKNLDKLSDNEKKSVKEFFEALNVLYSDNATDSEKEDALRNINISASPNRQKLYLDDLKSESGLYKILGEGKSKVRERLVKEASKYKDIPEDDNKNFIKAETLAKPDIGGGKGARAANKKKNKKYTDEVGDTNVDKIMRTPPLDRITKAAFRTLFGPADKDGNLLIPSSKNSKIYFEHSINNNTSLQKTSEFLKELADKGEAPKELSESLDSHQQRLQDIAKNYKIPSEEARKAVENSYAKLAEELHSTSPEYAGRLLKQFAEMEQYDSEIAGGDECYLPGHGSFPAGDKLLIEQGTTGGKTVSFISIKYGKSGSKKRTVYGCPANMSALQQLHPDESKRESLGQYVGQPGYTLAVKDDLISTKEKATETVKNLLLESGLGDTFSDEETEELGGIIHSTKERTEQLKKEATDSNGKVDYKKFNKLRNNDETIIANSRRLREICDEEKLSKIVGKRNAESMSKKLSADIFVASVAFVNQVKTADGYDFLKHNKQYIENGEIKNETTSGGTDMDGWFINPRMNRTPGRNGGGIQSSWVGLEGRDEINANISNSENID